MKKLWNPEKLEDDSWQDDGLWLLCVSLEYLNRSLLPTRICTASIPACRNNEAKDGEFNIIENELLLTPGVISDENVKENGLTENLLDDLWEMPRDSMSLFAESPFSTG